MASVRGRGRGRGGGGGGGGGEGSPKRGSWRGGPPGSNGPRSNTPVISGPANGPRLSINDHMTNLGKVDDRARKSTLSDILENMSSTDIAAFQTDSDIAASSGIAQRDLKRWVPDGPEPQAQQNGNGNARANRDSETFGNATTGTWDQFETHKRLFGGESTYDENLYTTKLDKSGPDYKKREKEAERLAKEIMGQSSANSHVAEERGQASKGNKDEEEKYSGVVRNPNAYRPPGARDGPAPGGFAAAAARGQAAQPGSKGTLNGKATPPAAPPIAVSASNNPALPAGLAPAPQAGPARRTSDGPDATTESAKPAPKETTEKSAAPTTAAAPIAEAAGSKDGPGLMGSALRFLQDEKKTARDRQIADLKKFNASFKVALPVPEDLLPLLSKDPSKQEQIQAKAAQSVIESKANALKSPKNITTPVKPETAKKTPMKIQAIPPFTPKAKPPAVPIAPTAGQNIALDKATSPGPGDAAATAAATAQAKATAAAQAKKLNPAASAFTFKPNPAASAFTPGQPPAPAPAAAPVAAPGPANAAPPGTAGAGPSNAYRNPFFSAPPRPVAVNRSTDFVPWLHNPAVPASSVSPQWPYSGGARWPPGGPNHMLEGDGPPGPGPMMMMPGMQQPPFHPYGGFRNPGMPPPNMGAQPMFSPGHGYAPLPGPPIHMGGGPPQPMYYQNGMPPQYMNHQMPFNPQGTPRQMNGPIPGHGPGPGQGPPPMYYQNGPQGLPTPQQTPHMQNNMQFPPPQQFQQQQMMPGLGHHGPGQGPGPGQAGSGGGGGYVSPPNVGGGGGPPGGRDH